MNKNKRLASASLPADSDPIKRYHDFIEKMRAHRAFCDVAWEEPVWNISSSKIRIRAHHDRAYRLFFTEHALTSRSKLSERAVMASPFADLAKACTVCRHLRRAMDPQGHITFLRVLRHMYACCPLPVRLDPTLLCREHFVRAEQLALSRENLLTAYKSGQFLEELSLLLERHGLVRAPLDFRSFISRPPNNDRTDASFEERVQRLPRRKLLDALADLANNPELLESPFDLMLMRQTEILLIAGFRIGELLTAPSVFLVRELLLDESGNPRLDAHSGKPVQRCGLRYWPEKGGEPIVKWLAAVANDLVERAICDLERLCLHARECARWLEEHPGRVRLDFEDHALLSIAEGAQLLNLAGPSQFRQWLRTGNRGGTDCLIRDDGGHSFIKAGDLKRALAMDRYEKPMIVREDGSVQSLSESFFVSFLNDSHKERATNPFIAVPFDAQSISDFLTGRKGVRSVFERYDHRDENGEPFRVRTHDFRRLMNVIFQRGGLSQVEIARWMGRRHVKDNEAYDLRTPSERAEEVRDLIRRGEVAGDVADQYAQLEAEEADVFLDNRVTTSHKTPHGHCLNNMAELPCPVAISCLSGCLFFARVKNDAASRAYIERTRDESLKELERAKAAEARGVENAKSWTHAHETVISNATRALAIDDDPSVQSGSVVQLNPQGENLGKPIER